MGISTAVGGVLSGLPFPHVVFPKTFHATAYGLLIQKGISRRRLGIDEVFPRQCRTHESSRRVEGAHLWCNLLKPPPRSITAKAYKTWKTSGIVCVPLVALLCCLGMSLYSVNVRFLFKK